jgi:diguanylate cyclase (GGDEF)-like protein
MKWLGSTTFGLARSHYRLAVPAVVIVSDGANAVADTMSLLLVDVDHFKRYNDFHGHQKGDSCLIRMAQALEGSVRRAGDLVARYGGEEFAMVLPDTDAAGARKVAQSICQRVLDLAIAHADLPVSAYVTVSIGSATMTVCGNAVHAMATVCRNCYPRMDCRGAMTFLIGLADTALYQAKRGGRARVESLDHVVRLVEQDRVVDLGPRSCRGGPQDCPLRSESADKSS